MKYVLIFFLFFSHQSFAQYYPRGVNINDNYLPDFDAPNKWILGLDGMYDLQKESTQNTNVTYEVTRANLNLFYGGQIFRTGLQVLNDVNRGVKDVSIGLGFTYNRPFFLEGGVGYLTRTLTNTSFDGTLYQAKVGYYFNWIMHIKYRVRIRLAFAFSYKKINSGLEQSVIHSYPLLGFEFET